MKTDIKLPPLPDENIFDAGAMMGAAQVMTVEDAQSYARAAVEADRQDQFRDAAKMMTVDELAQEIRRVDGKHSMGAGALAEALMPFLRRSSGQPAASAEPVGVSSPGQSDAAFNRWYESEFKPAMARGPFDKYVARQAWFAALRDALRAAPVAQKPVAWLRMDEIQKLPFMLHARKERPEAIGNWIPVYAAPVAAQAQPRLYQHDDGRYGLSSGPASFAVGDPAWHRVPIDVIDAAQPSAQDREDAQ